MEGTEVPGEVQERARRMGWVPQEEFRGDDKRWVDADKFVERGENELPIMRERLRKYDKEIVTLNNQISGMNETFGEFQKHQEKVAERAYDKALKDIKAKQDKAFKEQDEDAYEAAKKEEESLKKDEIPKGPTVDPSIQAAAAEFDGWKKDHEWFDKYPILAGAAIPLSAELEKKEGLTGIALYDRVEEEIQKMFPDKFENPNRSQPNSVVGDGAAPIPKGKRTFANLPAEAQAACERFVKDIPGYTKKQYLETYDWEA